MSFLSAYLLFIAKAVTTIIALLLAVAGIIALIGKNKQQKTDDDETLEVKYLNAEIAYDKLFLESEIMSKSEKKAAEKNEVKPQKDKPRLFVLDFDGDVEASETAALRRQITAILSTANPEKDQVLLRLESPGGLVNAYGFAAAQLTRLREANIYLTVAVDQVAASGGYMMACVANHIIAAPFAIVGSIGVVAQVPNIHRLLKDNKVDIEQHTAGKYKRTLTMLGENTEAGREKFIEELNEVHDLFKAHIKANRPTVNVDEVATGETWYGQQATENALIDAVMTSDDFILDATKTMDVYRLSLQQETSLLTKLKERFFAKQKGQIQQKYFM